MLASACCFAAWHWLLLPLRSAPLPAQLHSQSPCRCCACPAIHPSPVRSMQPRVLMRTHDDVGCCYGGAVESIRATKKASCLPPRHYSRTRKYAHHSAICHLDGLLPLLCGLPSTQALKFVRFVSLQVRTTARLAGQGRAPRMSAHFPATFSTPCRPPDSFMASQAGMLRLYLR